MLESDFPRWVFRLRYLFFNYIKSFIFCLEGHSLSSYIPILWQIRPMPLQPDTTSYSVHTVTISRAANQKRAQLIYTSLQNLWLWLFHEYHFNFNLLSISRKIKQQNTEHSEKRGNKEGNILNMGKVMRRFYRYYIFFGPEKSRWS